MDGKHLRRVFRVRPPFSNSSSGCCFAKDGYKKCTTTSNASAAVMSVGIPLIHALEPFLKKCFMTHLGLKRTVSPKFLVLNDFL